MAKDFFDFISDSFYSGKTKKFLEIFNEPNIEAKRLKKFFDDAGYEVDEKKCQNLINARDKLISDFGMPEDTPVIVY